jgi:hypothetical protein
LSSTALAGGNRYPSREHKRLIPAVARRLGQSLFLFPQSNHPSGPFPVDRHLAYAQTIMIRELPPERERRFKELMEQKDLARHFWEHDNTLACRVRIIKDGVEYVTICDARTPAEFIERFGKLFETAHLVSEEDKDFLSGLSPELKYFFLTVTTRSFYA